MFYVMMISAELVVAPTLLIARNAWMAIIGIQYVSSVKQDAHNVRVLHTVHFVNQDTF